MSKASPGRDLDGRRGTSQAAEEVHHHKLQGSVGFSEATDIDIDIDTQRQSMLIHPSPFLRGEIAAAL